MTDASLHSTGIIRHKPTWFQGRLETFRASQHQRKIIAALLAHEDEKNFQIVLVDGTELKITNGYEIHGGLLEFEHHSRGPLSISFPRISRVTSAADY